MSQSIGPVTNPATPDGLDQRLRHVVGTTAAVDPPTLAVHAVLDLHRRADHNWADMCEHCTTDNPVAWPCATVLAVAAALGVEV